MTEETGFFDRVSRWFKRQFRKEEDLPLLYGQTETSLAPLRRGLFPWTRGGGDIDLIESRLSAVTALMVALRSAIDQQSQRHDELLTYLSQLSHALQAIPDTARVQSETLRVLHQQIAYQNAQHRQLSEVLRKLGDSDGEQHTIIEGLRERVELLYATDQSIRETIGGMDTAVRQVSLNSNTSTLVLERLRDNLVNHETDLDKSLRRQNRHVLIALVICIVMSIIAIVTVIIVASWNFSAIEQLKVSQPAAATASPAYVQPVLPAPAVVPPAVAMPATAPASMPAPAVQPENAEPTPPEKPATQNAAAAEPTSVPQPAPAVPGNLIGAP